MIRQLHLLITLLLFCLSSQVSAETVTFDANAEGAAATEIKDGITIKMSGYSKTEKYYSVYNGGKATISAGSKKITKIVFTCYNNANSLYASTGKYTFSSLIGTWEGNENEITFTSYPATVTIEKIEVTYQPEGQQSAGLSFSETNCTAQLGTSFTAPTLENPHNLTVTYSSSNTNVATVDASTGEVTLVAAGTTTIIASSEETTDYLAGSASYELTVSAASDTKQSADLSFPVQSVTATVQQDVSEPTLSNPHGLADITYGSSNSEVARVDAKTGEVTAVAVGTAVITASFAGNDQYEAGAASYTIVVVSGVLKFRKATSVTAGKRYMIVGQDGDGLHAAKSAVSQSALETVPVEATDNIITVDNTDCVFTLRPYENGIFNIVLNDGRYLAMTTHLDVYLGPTKDSSSNYAQWSVEIYSNDNLARIKNKKEGRFLLYGTAKQKFQAFQTTSGNSRLYPYLYEEVTSSSNDVTVSVSEVGYATLYYSDRALKVPKDVTAMVYSYDKGDKKLSVSKRYNAGVTIPKGTAVVLAAESGKYTFAVSDEDGEAPSASNLYGYDEQKTTAVDGMTKYYKLSLDADKTEGSVGFYWGATDGGAFESQAHKAFLALPDEASANCFVFVDITDGISSVTSGRYTDKGAIYSLTGVRMSGPLPAGIYIRDGKKFVVK